MSTNTEIKSDKYELPIYYTLKYSKPSTMEELKEDLDNTGYYGRYMILKEPLHKKQGLNFRIKVYLPDSVKYYLFPHIGCVNLEKSNSLRKLEKSIPEGTCDVFMEAHKTGWLDFWKIAIAKRMTFKKVNHIIDFLHEINMAKNLRLSKFHSNDLKEVCANIFMNR